MKKTPDNHQETYLSDWLSGKITDEELLQFVTESDFNAYRKLRFSLQSIDLGPPDLDRNFNAIQDKIALKTQQQSKVRRLYVYTSLAAALLVLFGLYHLLAFSNTVQTSYGKQQTLALTDGSEVVLNANSSVSYPTFFSYNRNLKLCGQAYFKVAKGSTFTVETAQGKVQVLGTQFDVLVQKDFLEVHCFEGKVSVTTSTATKVLTHGESLRFFNQTAETWQDLTHTKSSWIDGETSFKNAPMQAVIAQFESQYHYKVGFPKSLANVRFTGSFTNDNWQVALQSICLPLQLKFEQTNSETIHISE